ncbi:hypothetical protein HOY82DRAFT_534936 [Tuber indicum]|nr:hypothetical protein HOY82DRAFT_534936 [Tuber indicum]
MHPTYTCQGENSRTRTHKDSADTEKAAHIDHEPIITLAGVNGFLVTCLASIHQPEWKTENSAWSIGKIPATVCKTIVHLMRGSARTLYGQKGIISYDIRCRPNIWMYPQIAGTCQPHGLYGGALRYGVGDYFGAACRIAHKKPESTPTSIPFLLPNSLTACGFQFANCIHSGYGERPIKQFTSIVACAGAFLTGRHNMREEGKGKHKARIDDTNLKRTNTTLREVADSNSKTRNHRQATAYSKMTEEDAQIRLGVRLSLPGIPIADMLERKRVLLEPSTVQEVKRETYKELVRFKNIEGYPDGSSPGFKEAIFNDLVAFTLSPLLDHFKRKSIRNLLLLRVSEIKSLDLRTRVERYIMVLESKWYRLSDARKQCFLSLRDMRDSNGGGTVYGFVTTGEYWNMITFDGQFQISETISLLFESMSKDEQKWLDDYSILVDCFQVALTNAAERRPWRL